MENNFEEVIKTELRTDGQGVRPSEAIELERDRDT